MSQSPSLSFGPAWMRPKVSKTASQEQRSFSRDNSNYQPLQRSQKQQDQEQQLHTNGKDSSKIHQFYTVEELLEVWGQIQTTLQRNGFEEKYKSLDPIRQLVQQVEYDRSIQSGKKDSSQVVELAEKLNEINSWAENENTGLDIAGILKNVTKSSSASQDHFKSARTVQHPRDSPLISNGLLPQPQLLQPSQINWFYLDPNGIQQGPFDGLLMQSWYSQGYLTLDLHIHRDDELQFYLLKDFITSVGNGTEPFLIPLQSLKQTPFQGFDFGQRQLSGFFGNDQPSSNGSSILSQPQPQLPQLANAQQTWASSQSGRSSPWLTQQTTVSEHFSNQDFRIGAQSPFLSSSLLDQSSILRGGDSSQQQQQQQQQIPQTPQQIQSQPQQSHLSTETQEQDEEIFNQIQSQVLGDVLRDETEPSFEQEPVDLLPKSSEQIKPQEFITREETTSKQNSKSSKASSIQASQTKAKVEILKNPSKQQAQTQSTSAKSKPTSAKIITEKQPSTEIKATNAGPQLAPWASKPTANAKPQLTLDQIQQLDAEEVKKQAKAKAEVDKITAAQLLASTEKEEHIASVAKVALPSAASWGSASQPSTPSKTILDIQREEAEAAARAIKQQQSAAAAAAAVAALASNSNGTPIVKPALPSKNSFALVANTPTTGNAWTTVASAKKPVVKPASTTKIASSINAAKTNPDVLRSVSAITNPHQTTTTSFKSVSPRQEFLAWCRSTIKLNLDVNKEDVLQIMLMLPVGSESSEIIADTIYSNSSTMDGRRFAQEFMKRRKAVEDQVNDGLSWNDALFISAEDDNDGWDFQVVGKKNKRKN